MRQEYTRFTIQEEQELLPFLMKAMQGISRSRAKAILSGGGVRVNRAIVKQFDTPLKPRDIVEVSKQKPKATFQNRYVRIVYEDHHVIVSLTLKCSRNQAPTTAKRAASLYMPRRWKPNRYWSTTGRTLSLTADT